MSVAEAGTSRRTLPRRWSITELRGRRLAKPVRDVEALCASVIRGAAPRALSDSEYHDALGHLLGEVVILLPAYDLDRDGNGGNLLGFLSQRLGHRLRDEWRKTIGKWDPLFRFRDGERGRPARLVSLDERDPGAAGLVDALAGCPGDDPADRATSLERVLAADDRDAHRDEHLFGLTADRRAPRRDRARG